MPIVVITLELAHSEVEEYIILTITVLFGDESLLPHCFMATASYTASRFPLFRCNTHLNSLTFGTYYFQLSGERKKCINNVFHGCILPQIHGNTNTISKDGWLKAIFDHFHCARSLLPFFVSPLRLNYFQVFVSYC